MQSRQLKRRRFLTLLGGAAAWPLAARAQSPAMPVIGFMSGRSPEDSSHLLAALRNGLSDFGFVEGQNIAIEFRWAGGQYDRLPSLAAELVALRVAVLAALGGDASAAAAKQATSVIPIVYGKHAGGLLGVARVFRAAVEVAIVIVDLPKERVAFDVETPEVVFVVGIIVAIELIEHSDALEYLGSNALR